MHDELRGINAGVIFALIFLIIFLAIIITILVIMLINRKDETITVFCNPDVDNDNNAIVFRASVNDN